MRILKQPAETVTFIGKFTISSGLYEYLANRLMTESIRKSEEIWLI